jgi:hypothetical protein
MARKQAKPVQATKPNRTGRGVRLDLADEDHERLERQARQRGLNKASYARMAVLERIKRDEENDR